MGDEVAVDVAPLRRGADGEVTMPKLKLGIRGSYVFEASGRSVVPSPAWTDTCTSYAAVGPTLIEVLEQVRSKGPCYAASSLIDAMPQVIAAVKRRFNFHNNEAGCQPLAIGRRPPLVKTP